MHAAPMTPGHQHPACAQAAPGHCPWDWPLPAGRATVLPEASAARWLVVHSGRVWLTGLDTRRQAQDIWLDAGAHHPLPAGTAWLLEGWPDACVGVLLAAPQ